MMSFNSWEDSDFFKRDLSAFILQKRPLIGYYMYS